MIIWGSVLLRRTVCGDIDIIRASWLDPDDEFAQVVETSVNVITNIPSPDYTHPENHTSPTYDMTHGSKNFYKITTGLNFNFHLRPTFTQKALRTVACIAGEVGKGEGERARERNGGLAPRYPFFSHACSPSPFPTSPAMQAMRTAVAVYEFHVTRNCF